MEKYLFKSKPYFAAKPTIAQILFDKFRHRKRFRAMQYVPKLNSEQKSLLSDLKKNGYVILKNHISSSELQILQAEFNNALEDMQFNTPCLAQSKINPIKHASLLNNNLVGTPDYLSKEGLTFHKQDCKNYKQVLDDFNPSTLTVPMLQHSDLFRKIYLDESILILIAHYMNMVPQLGEAYVRRNFPAPYRTMNHYWHRDLNHHSHLLKVFIFLTDCNDDNGPHEYIKGSCTNADQLMTLNGQRYYNDEDVDKAYPLGNSNRIVSHVSAGTVIIEDTRGLHRANIPKNSYRDLGYAIFAPILENSPALYKLPSEYFENSTELQKLFIPNQVIMDS